MKDAKRQAMMLEPAAYLDEEINCAYTPEELDGGYAHGLIPLYADPQEQFQQVGWAISYDDGKTPYSFWALEYSQLVDAGVKRLGGTACKIALFARVPK